jgi:hypothetical protein
VIKAFLKLKDAAAADLGRRQHETADRIHLEIAPRNKTRQRKFILTTPCTKDFGAHHILPWLPSRLMKDGAVGPGDAIECPSAETAIVSAEILSRIEGNIGVIAFSRTGDTDTGQFKDAVMLKTFGDIPADLTMMF